MKLTKSTILDVIPYTYWLVNLQPKEHSLPRNEIIYVVSVNEEKQAR